jgi:hypothetical protein
MKVKKENDVSYYDSSNILFSTYDNVEEKLYICFNYGQIYIFEGINQELNDTFEEAESQGKFFVENIKSKYPFKKDFNKLGEFEREGVKSFIQESLKEIKK